MQTILKHKHNFFIVIFFIFSLCHLSAQQQEKLPKQKSKNELFAFGPKVAVNFTNIKPQHEAKFMSGIDMGLFFRISIFRLYIQPEISYVIRNMSIRTENGLQIEINKYETHHINFPLLVGVKVIDVKNFKLRFFAGPEYNLIRKTDKMKKIVHQLGMQVGLGFDIWRFTIDAGYSFLGNIHPHNKSYNNVFRAGVGFKCY